MHYSSKIALRREKLGESAPFWRFSAASYPDLKEATLVDALSEVARQAPDTKSSDFSVEVPSWIVFFLHTYHVRQVNSCRSDQLNFNFSSFLFVC